MAGFKRGSRAWVQHNIGHFTEKAKTIHKNSPESDGELKELISIFGHMFETLSNPKATPTGSIIKVITDKVFED